MLYGLSHVERQN